MHIGEQKMKWLSERLHHLREYYFSILFGNFFKFRRNFIEIALLHRHIKVIKM